MRRDGSFSQRFFWQEDSLLWKMIFLSLLTHLIFFSLGKISWKSRAKPSIEIDLTTFTSLGPKRAARPSPPRIKPQEWTRPNKETSHILPAPAKKSAPSSPSPPLSATATNPSAASGETTNQISRFPQLINLKDLQIILQRLYPEEARLNHIEASVVLDIHLDDHGHVLSTDIIKSAGSAFDNAAQKAAQLLKFTPAYIGVRPIAVKIRQAINFKLDQSQ